MWQSQNCEVWKIDDDDDVCRLHGTIYLVWSFSQKRRESKWYAQNSLVSLTVHLFHCLLLMVFQWFPSQSATASSSSSSFTHKDDHLLQ
jgi:hypothetical protein